MGAQSDDLKSGVRASDSECLRRQAYQVVPGTPRDQPKDTPQGEAWQRDLRDWRERGRFLEWRTLNVKHGMWWPFGDEGEAIEGEYGVDGTAGSPNLLIPLAAQEQLRVPWGPDGMWIAHPDYKSEPSGRLIEVLSTSHNPDQLVARKAKQLMFSYILGGFEIDGYEPYVYQVDSARWSRIYEFKINPEGYREEVEHAARVLSDLFERFGGQEQYTEEQEKILPDRVCDHRNSSAAGFCPFVDHCFRDQGELDLNQVPGAWEAVGTLADSEASDEDKNAAKALLAPWVPPGTKGTLFSEDGEVRDIRCSIRTNERLSLTAMRAHGFEIPAEVRPFIKTTKSISWRATIKEAP